MKVCKPLAAVYGLAVLLLALCGAGLMFTPDTLLVLAHGVDRVPPVSVLLSQQTGLGLLLAAAINLVCLAGGPTRRPLHLAVLFYLAGLVASHGEPAFGASAWLWIPVLLYALPLLPWEKLPWQTPPSPGATGRRRGEVKWFNPKKGFGFILADNGEEIFVHFKAVRDGGRRSLRAGTPVSFVTRQSERGEQADQVEIRR